jgi:hypothetical protein
MVELTQSSISQEDEIKETQDTSTEEAPYGYKADGTPRKRPGRPPGSYSGTGKKKSFDSLKEPLADRIVEYIGPPIAFVSPLGLAVIEDRADKTAAALCTLAATRPRVAKIIQGLIAGSASADVVLTGVAVLIAIGVEHHRIEPNSMPSHYFRIDEFYAELYGDNVEANGQQPRSRGLMSEIE